jgi:hypothetical protein
VADQVAVTLPVEDGLPAADYVGLAELAERAGYHAVLAGEVAGSDVFSLLGMIAGIPALGRSRWVCRYLSSPPSSPARRS